VPGGLSGTRLPRKLSKLCLRALRAGSEGQKEKNVYYTYVLRSEKDNDLYIGYTDNLKRRFDEHQKGLVPATKVRRPLILVYYEACLNKERAILREKYFKTGFGRTFLKNRL